MRCIHPARMRPAHFPHTGRMRLSCGAQCKTDAEQNRTELNRSELSSLSYGSHVVLPTVDSLLTAVDVRARRKIGQPAVEELAPLTFGGQR